MQQEELAQKIVIAWGDCYATENKGNVFRQAVDNVVDLYKKRDEMFGLLPIA